MALTDNFDSYTAGSDLNGQGSWSIMEYGNTSAFDVGNSVTQSGANGVEITLGGSGIHGVGKTFTGESAGKQVFYVRGTASNSRVLILLREGSTPNIIIYFQTNSGKIGYYSAGVVDHANVSVDTWYKVEIEWRSSPSKQFQMTVDNGTPSGFVNPYIAWTTNIDTLMLDADLGTGSGTAYIDSLSDPNTAQNYTRGNYAALPSDDADLETAYSASDITDVATSNDVRVAQAGTLEYMVHQYKDNTAGHAGISSQLECRSTLAPTASTIFLQVYNQDSTTWETLDSDNTTGANTDFVLTGYIADLTNYRDGNGSTSHRVYQQAL